MGRTSLHSHPLRLDASLAVDASVAGAQGLLAAMRSVNAAQQQQGGHSQHQEVAELQQVRPCKNAALWTPLQDDQAAASTEPTAHVGDIMMHP